MKSCLRFRAPLHRCEKMYPNSKINVMIIVFVATTFLGTLLLRTQTFGDVQYMKAMIPHHHQPL
jgi:uncharacterized protein (DUF305 family)